MRYVRVDGLGVVLDLQSATYKILDEIATLMWEHLIGDANSDVAVKAWSGEYEVDAATARLELELFTKKCCAEGLLHRAEPDCGKNSPRGVEARPISRNPRVPLTVKALCCLALTYWRLRAQGFGATYTRYAGLVCAPAFGTCDASLQAFVRAENFFLSRRSPDDCLLRSLALFRYLCWEGVPAEHVIGVQRIPFLAHAWVECDGRAMLDGRVNGFTAIARMSPAAAHVLR